MTSDITYLAQRQIDAIGGHDVDPHATFVTAPFLIKQGYILDQQKQDDIISRVVYDFMENRIKIIIQ